MQRTIPLTKSSGLPTALILVLLALGSGILGSMFFLPTNTFPLALVAALLGGALFACGLGSWIVRGFPLPPTRL